MKNDQEKTLEEVLREMPWRNIVIPLLLSLLVIAAVIFFSVRTVAQESPVPNITVVHSGESLTIKWNPVTHEEVRNETADGGVILTVQPKERTNE